MRNLLFILSILTLAYSCATISSPKGGPRDESPPEVDSLQSMPNFLTNFDQDRIEIFFNEWIKLEDIGNQVIISPPIEGEEIYLRGKALRIDFGPKTELKENATYSINFGESIKDITESNVLKDYKYVFSTGSFIDSLVIHGEVKDAFTNEPLENIIVMVYDESSDSLVFTEKPFYFGRTDKSGSYSITNVKNCKCKIFALDDLDLNYLYRPGVEKMGFPDSLISIENPITHIDLRLSTTSLDLSVLDVFDTEFGITKVLYNRDPSEVKVSGIQPHIATKTDGDTLFIFHNYEEGIDSLVWYTSDGLRIDTIKSVHNSTKAYFGREIGSSFMKNPPISRFDLKFSQPILLFDSSKVQILDTGLIKQNFSMSLDSNDKFLVTMRLDSFKTGVSYKLFLEPGSIQNSFLESNTDSIAKTIVFDEVEKFGIIDLSVKNLDSATQFLVYLYHKDQVVEKEIVVNASEFSKKYTHLLPGEYFVRVIYDVNKNGKFDPGDYSEKRQPEKVHYQKLEQLRANWELAVSVDLKN